MINNCPKEKGGLYAQSSPYTHREAYTPLLHTRVHLPTPGNREAGPPTNIPREAYIRPFYIPWEASLGGIYLLLHTQGG